MIKNIVRFLFIVVVAYLFFYLYEQKRVAKNRSVKVTIKEAELKDIADEKYQSLKYLNTLRKKAGLTELYINKKLELSAQNHANYLVKNDEIGHFEKVGKPLFTGQKPVDRVLYVGYNTRLISENVSNNSFDYKDSIDGLFSAIYHRFGFLDFQISEIGVGVAQNQKQRDKNAYVYNMGISELNTLCKKDKFNGYGKYVYKVCKDESIKIKESIFKEALNASRLYNKKIVIYPNDEQRDILPAFFDEIPDPLPKYRVSGFPISIQFNEYYFKKVKVISFKLFDKDNNEIKDTLLYDHFTDINFKFKKFEFALFPLKRLSWNSRYRVVVHYIADGKQEVKEWSFKTYGFDVPLYKVTKDKYTFNIEPNKATIFYIEPSSKTDILGDLQYPDSLDITFIDKNTIKVIPNKRNREYQLKLGTHRLNLKVR